MAPRLPRVRRGTKIAVGRGFLGFLVTRLGTETPDRAGQLCSTRNRVSGGQPGSPFTAAGMETKARSIYLQWSRVAISVSAVAFWPSAMR